MYLRLVRILFPFYRHVTEDPGPFGVLPALFPQSLVDTIEARETLILAKSTATKQFVQHLSSVVDAGLVRLPAVEGSLTEAPTRESVPGGWAALRGGLGGPTTDCPEPRGRGRCTH
jgi:hypothetical protein